jgi:hypothetical protein
VSTLLDSGVSGDEPRSAAQGHDGGFEPIAADSGEAGAMAPPQPTGEACGASTCSTYAYCSSEGDAGAQCRAKRNQGSSCSQARTCMTGLCSGGVCQPEPTPRSCTGTWDCSLETAEYICRGRDCHVCVQIVDAQGKPRVYGAVEPASCLCPLPTARAE